MPSTEIKIALRNQAIAKRAAVKGEERHRATEAIAERAFARLTATQGVVGLYSAIRDELHPGGLIERLAAAGRAIGLPCTPKFGQPLVFRAWKPGDPLVKGHMNIPEPPAEAPEVFPQVLVAPPVGFDRRCYRIGYGAGFYDRTIPKLRAMHPVVALGVAFACQELEGVPAEPHDVPLDAIATEREWILAGATA